MGFVRAVTVGAAQAIVTLLACAGLVAMAALLVVAHQGVDNYMARVEQQRQGQVEQPATLLEEPEGQPLPAYVVVMHLKLHDETCKRQPKEGDAASFLVSAYGIYCIPDSMSGKYANVQPHSRFDERWQKWQRLDQAQDAEDIAYIKGVLKGDAGERRLPATGLLQTLGWSHTDIRCRAVEVAALWPEQQR